MQRVADGWNDARVASHSGSATGHSNAGRAQGTVRRIAGPPL